MSTRAVMSCVGLPPAGLRNIVGRLLAGARIVVGCPLAGAWSVVGSLLAGARSVRKRTAYDFLSKLTLLSLAATAFAAEPAGPTPLEEPWQTRLPAFSLDAPPRADSPILLYFTADWCGFCKQMERTTLAEPEVRARVGGLRAHKLDFDAQGGLVKRFGVRGIPAFVLTNDRGDVIDRLTGARSKEDFLRWLDQAGGDFTRHAQTAAVRAEALRTLPAEARSEDPAVRAKALDALWTLAGRAGESERASAAAQLIDLAAATPAVWRAGLGHMDLAVRVAAANLLHETSGAKLTFDPWAEEPARAAALDSLGF